MPKKNVKKKCRPPGSNRWSYDLETDSEPWHQQGRWVKRSYRLLICLIQHPVDLYRYNSGYFHIIIDQDILIKLIFLSRNILQAYILSVIVLENAHQPRNQWGRSKPRSAWSYMIKEHKIVQNKFSTHCLWKKWIYSECWEAWLSEKVKLLGQYLIFTRQCLIKEIHCHPYPLNQPVFLDICSWLDSVLANKRHLYWPAFT